MVVPMSCAEHVLVALCHLGIKYCLRISRRPARPGHGAETRLYVYVTTGRQVAKVAEAVYPTGHARRDAFLEAVLIRHQRLRAVV